MKVVLYQPEIPQNTGNVVRTCAVTGSGLILVRPLGFSLASRHLKRAGLDYWEGVDVQTIDSLEEFLEKSRAPFTFFSSKAQKCYLDVDYQEDHLLIFGSETSGLPSALLERFPDCSVRIPMLGGQRCLNLATSVGIGLYGALQKRPHFGILYPS